MKLALRAAEDWVDYDDEDDFISGRELITVSPTVGSSPATSAGHSAAQAAYGGSYSGVGAPPAPYGGIPMIPHYAPPFSPPPLASQSPPSPPPKTVRHLIDWHCWSRSSLPVLTSVCCTQAVTSSYSISATVPGVTSSATLTNYANVAAFNSTERERVGCLMKSSSTHRETASATCLSRQSPDETVCSLQFIATLESNIFKLLNALANVTIDSVVASSVKVGDTIAFTGSDSDAAAGARDALVTALNSGDTSVFGTSFGSVAVSGVSATNSSNPSKLVVGNICAIVQFVHCKAD